MNNVNLSVVIVNYKSWQALEQCLDSFIEFTPKLNYEIIVVDNDSQDGQLGPFSQKYPTVKFVNNSGNHGFSNGCNRGAENVTGEYLLFLNPDVILTDSPAIDEMVSFAKKNPGVGITSCRTINPKGKPEREITFSNHWLIISWLRALYKLVNKSKIHKKFPENKAVWHPSWVSGSVVLIKNELFQKVGKWGQNNFWMYYEDVDLCRKVKAQNKNIALLRNVELKHSHGVASRRNQKITAITKSEVVTSSHVYIQLHTQGLNRLLLHFAIIIDTLLSQLVKILFTFPIFWKTSFKENLFTLSFIIRYYANATMCRTWKSKRLHTNKHE